MSFNVTGKIGTNYTAYSDANGRYSQSVIDGWIGNLVPTAPTGNAVPESVYLNVGRDYIYDFTFERGYLISGIVSNEIGVISDVTMSFTASSSELMDVKVYTDANGYYSLRAPDNWTGTVTPSSTSSLFAPVNRSYTNIKQTSGSQDFTPTQYYYISGSVSGSGTVENVTMSFDGTPSYEVYTNASGLYIETVRYSWTGTLTPVSESASFSPASRTINSVTASQIVDKFTLI